MTCQVADVATTNREIRRVVLIHGVIFFLLQCHSYRSWREHRWEFFVRGLAGSTRVPISLWSGRRIRR
ncbi:hypothetical protein [Filomicrobium insigne]|uniref:hypothetical protein n=1 Tax=Filomicrobium insigne TaxID=418854 RepID=UPI0014808BB9